jgi:basic amino acid/polyamine antiporter, APA family
MNSLFARKSIAQLQAEAEETEHGLHRTLTAFNLTTLGIGAIIGAGIFTLTGVAAAQYAGPAIVLSFVLGGIACAFAGLCYAEMASTVPIAGSAYTYAYATMGELMGWIIGWDLCLEYAVGATTVAVSWSGYVVSFLGKQLGIHIPAMWCNGPPVGIANLPAVVIVLAVTTLLVIGVKESANFTSAIVVIKVLVVIAFIGACIGFVKTVNWVPFIPENTGTLGHFGWSGILRGAGVVFFAYIGFDAVSTAAQEARDPQRDMPRGILGSLAICTVLYVAVAAVMVGLVPYAQLGGAAPMAVAVDGARVASAGSAWAPFMNLLPVLVKVGIIAGLSSTMVVQMMAQPRIFMAMSQDGLLPAWASRIHPTYRTPHLTTMLTGLIVGLAAGFTPIDVLGHMVSIGTLFAFVIVSIGVIVLRRAQPGLHRPFRTPWVPVVPMASALVSLGLMLSLPAVTWERLAIWMVVGIAVYFLYGRRRSRLEPGATRPSGR